MRTKRRLAMQTWARAVVRSRLLRLMHELARLERARGNLIVAREHADIAIDRYSTLLVTTPKAVYHQRIEELRGI